MMTLSPATGTLRLGQVAGSDQFVALAAGAAGLWACTIVNTLTSNEAEINDIRRNERFFFLSLIPSQRRERPVLNGLSAAQKSPRLGAGDFVQFANKVLIALP